MQMKYRPVVKWRENLDTYFKIIYLFLRSTERTYVNQVMLVESFLYNYSFTMLKFNTRTLPVEEA